MVDIAKSSGGLHSATHEFTGSRDSTSLRDIADAALDANTDQAPTAKQSESAKLETLISQLKVTGDKLVLEQRITTRPEGMAALVKSMGPI